MRSIDEKIQRLRDIYTASDDQRAISDLEKNLRRLIVTSKLNENEAAIAIVDYAVEEIKNINTLLAYDEKLTDVQREGLFRKREVHMFYLDRFNSEKAEQIIADMENYIDTRL